MGISPEAQLLAAQIAATGGIGQASLELDAAGLRAASGDLLARRTGSVQRPSQHCLSATQTVHLPPQEERRRRFRPGSTERRSDVAPLAQTAPVHAGL